MDETSSTTFVLFDHIVTQFIGWNVQDLIAEMNKVTFLFYNFSFFFQIQVNINHYKLPFNLVQPENKSINYPLDFNFFMDKILLFKVEVSDVNVNRKWRNYGVKRATDEVEVINEFIKKYNLNVFFVHIVLDNHISMEFYVCRYV